MFLTWPLLALNYLTTDEQSGCGARRSTTRRALAWCGEIVKSGGKQRPDGPADVVSVCVLTDVVSTRFGCDENSKSGGVYPP